MKDRIMKFMRWLTMAGATISMSLLVIGILYNDGAWSMPGVVGTVIFSTLRFGVFGTANEKQEMGDAD